MAIQGGVENKSDMTLSGINNASNLGDDLLVSFTAAAAVEGTYLRLTPLAVSLISKQEKIIALQHKTDAIYRDTSESTNC